jgi:hypothetical protein
MGSVSKIGALQISWVEISTSGTKNKRSRRVATIVVSIVFAANLLSKAESSRHKA